MQKASAGSCLATVSLPSPRSTLPNAGAEIRSIKGADKRDQDIEMCDRILNDA